MFKDYFWSSTLQAIKFGFNQDYSFPSELSYAILDSGSPLIMVPESIFENVVEKIFDAAAKANDTRSATEIGHLIEDGHAYFDCS